MGHGAVFDLINNSPDVESVTVADFDLKKADAVADAVDPARVTPHHIDASNESDVARSVSYTHLDVYKRQPLKRFFIQCSPNLATPLKRKNSV